MVSTVLFFVILLVNKDKLTEIASKSIKTQADSESKTSESAFLDSAYNYTQNGLAYEITFL
ncbi:MAG: hypothetical protein IPO21_13240 [Bacteroidales bacterium]|nr:hypothetical protein [Bacteroidales bacterium]